MRAGDPGDGGQATLGSLAYGGDAVGRIGGKAIFVPFGAPGDLASLRIVDERSSYLRGEIVEIVKASAARQEPRCELFGSCGGCQWQHLRYEEQLRAKREIVASALRRLPVEALELQPAANQLGYRRRARLRWRSRARRTILGFFRRGTRELLDVESCPLLASPLNSTIGALRELLAARDGDGSVDLLAGAGGEVHADIRCRGGKLPPPRALLDSGLVGGLLIEGRYERRFGAPAIPLDERGVRGSASAFAQASAAEDVTLRQEVARHADVAGGERVIELFAGVGNLTVELAGRAERVVAVEQDREAVGLLRANARHLHGVEVEEGDSAVALARRCSQRFDLVLLDPPRKGAARSVSRISAARPSRVVYVSCDPMTLARDLDVLVESGYGDLRATIIDMMPHTFRVEIVVSLRLAVT